MQRAAKAAEIKQAFRRAIEGHAHAVEQVNNGGRSLAHGLDRRLIRKKVSAVNCVVEVLPGGVPLALQILRGVNSALRANRMRALDRHNGKQIHMAAHFGDLNDGRQPCEPATHDDDFWITCHLVESNSCNEDPGPGNINHSSDYLSASLPHVNSSGCGIQRMVYESISF